jgi:hypothetical protein
MTTKSKTTATVELIHNQAKVDSLLAKHKTVEQIASFLVDNDDYRTKTEARGAIEAYLEASNKKAEKKVPMSAQFKTWFLELSAEHRDALTDKELHAKAVEIGMSEKSADWYARVYKLAYEVAKEINK